MGVVQQLVDRGGGYGNARRSGESTNLPPVPMIELDCREFAVDDVLLLHCVSFYAHNPAMRAELGTDAARARFEARDFA
ncbi:hypothetical protein [Prescottella equi]|uniref:hypothetical protein n=1 Tax=Rhodococcus hoagii TaxID=43767 RepID=UPI001585A088|nr:hypothetical protein [Prescottella equi]